MDRAKAPPLYRASLWVYRAATILSVILLLYVGLSIYSASQIRPGNAEGSGIGESVGPAGFQLNAAVNFSNPGFFAVSNVHLDSVVQNPGGGSILARGSSP